MFSSCRDIYVFQHRETFKNASCTWSPKGCRTFWPLRLPRPRSSCRGRPDLSLLTKGIRESVSQQCFLVCSLCLKGFCLLKSTSAFSNGGSQGGQTSTWSDILYEGTTRIHRTWGLKTLAMTPPQNLIMRAVGTLGIRWFAAQGNGKGGLAEDQPLPALAWGRHLEPNLCWLELANWHRILPAVVVLFSPAGFCDRLFCHLCSPQVKIWPVFFQGQINCDSKHDCFCFLCCFKNENRNECFLPCG